MIKHFNTVWLVVVAALLLLLALNPTLVSRESISQLLGQLGTSALIVYILLSLTRAVIMIPSTPFILAGAISFPEMPILIFVISYIGVVVGTLLI
ncbi:MAG: putative membrane protein YdjX (TVP38/TMEM64 family), partial [Pseudohongiellaceae bacterium]